MTTWSPIAGAPGWLVSDSGQISLNGAEVTPSLAGRDRSYKRVHCPTDHGTGSRYVHEIVLTTFHGRRPTGLMARHLNGDSLDNRASNLQWGTQAENEQDKVRHGTHHEASMTHCARGHEFNDLNTYRPPGQPTKRMCRPCRAERRESLAGVA